MNHPLDPLSPSFLVSCCPTCRRDRVAHRVLLGDELSWACETCDTPLDERQGRWVHAQELDELGYFVDGSEEVTAHGGGGCRGGRCGIAQPGDD